MVNVPIPPRREDEEPDGAAAWAGRSARSSSEQDRALAEAHEAAGLAEDEMVEKLDADELAGGSEASSEGDVVGRWLRVAGRMVVALM